VGGRYWVILRSGCIMREDGRSLMERVLRLGLEVCTLLLVITSSKLLSCFAGHATIGGLGPISRQWGTTLDHVREVEVVLANGTITRASDSFQPDLYFVCRVFLCLPCDCFAHLYLLVLVLQAIRGAAASFGIVTEFVFQTNPEPPSTVQYSYTFVYASFLSVVHITASWFVCLYRIGDYHALAQTFSKWQNIISQPNLDRKLASTFTVTPVGLVISGIALSFPDTPWT